jgi:hypothetical protein
MDNMCIIARILTVDPHLAHEATSLDNLLKLEEFATPHMLQVNLIESPAPYFEILFFIDLNIYLSSFTFTSTCNILMVFPI